MDSISISLGSRPISTRVPASIPTTEQFWQACRSLSEGQVPSFQPTWNPFWHGALVAYPSPDGSSDVSVLLPHPRCCFRLPLFRTHDGRLLSSSCPASRV